MIRKVLLASAAVSLLISAPSVSTNVADDDSGPNFLDGRTEISDEATLGRAHLRNNELTPKALLNLAAYDPALLLKNGLRQCRKLGGLLGPGDDFGFSEGLEFFQDGK